MRVYLGLGSNLGKRWHQLGEAVEALTKLDEALLVSSVYETAPLGGPEGQGRFLNCVVGLDSALSPHQLLQFGLDLEQRAGRVRVERWGPRPLDVDILIIEGLELDEPDLIVPHPRINARAFVLAPLEQLRPDLVSRRWRQALGGSELVSSQIRQVGELVRSADAGTTGTGEPGRNG